MFISNQIAILVMKSKELFKQTFVKRHRDDLMVIVVLGLLFGGLSSGLIIAIVFANLIVGVAVCIIAILSGVLLIIREGRNDLVQTVNLFIGDHKYNKFVELSLKYLGYESKILDENDKTKRNFIMLNNKHLVYVAEYSLSLGDIDNACKIAKEEDKSLTIIMNDRDITSEASAVAKQGGIIIHNHNDLYNTLHETIKTKGGEPIRECLCT